MTIATRLRPFHLLALSIFLSSLAVPLGAQSSATAQNQPEAATPASPTSAANPPATSDETAPSNQPATTETPATPPEKHPKLTAAELIHDAGRVIKGSRIAVQFTLENQGDADLEIKNVQPSCGCTVASFERRIAPGKAGKVRAWIDTSALSGAIEKFLIVTSNDPTTPRLQLAVKAEVLSFVTAAPSYVRILQVQSEPSATTAINLWSDGDPPLEIRGVRAPHPWIEAKARPATASELRPEGPKQQWRLEVSAAADAPLGPLDDTLVVRTNHPKQPELRIPLSGFVRPVLEAVPEVADFGKLGQGAPRTRYVVKLFNFGSSRVEVESVSTNLPFVSASVRPEQDGRRFRIELDLASDAPKGKFSGTLEISTTSPVLHKLEVPIRGKVD